MGRRWGKTTMAGACALTWANACGHAVAWVVPTYKNARSPWRFAESACRQVRGSVEIIKSERIVRFPSGGWLGIYTADNPVGILGESFDAVIIDEAARIPEDVWGDAILPTLADRDGVAMLISTPKGRNWFWREWQRGHRGETGYASWQAPTSANPSPSIQRAAALARERVSDRTYRQEWLAEFVEDGGGVFRGVRRLATATPQRAAQDGHAYIIGVDWGRTNDATVYCVLDATTMEQVAADRMTATDYGLQVQRLRALWERFGRCLIVAEQNSMGGPLIEQMSREGMQIRAFQTTNASKQVIIDALALAFEREALHILPDEAQIGELEAYESERLPSGAIRYSAPDGMHDDYVMALALAYSRVGRVSSAVGAFL
jgi:Terminase large subunit, T4likevirus-type, N-terminal/Terminase RNaseH-like domain